MPALPRLVSGIINDAQDMAKQQFILLKHEVRADLRRGVSAIAGFATGACFGFVGILFLALRLCHLLQWIVPTLPL
jgi:Putative Actinobacterial Holin-X, holin superfamily III